ncbi:MAG: hypothetical protein FWC38_10465 [Proteobacteria bacterium]|nr:hypothetical protein [Pseudomonadota bacterium]
MKRSLVHVLGGAVLALGFSVSTAVWAQGVTVERPPAGLQDIGCWGVGVDEDFGPPAVAVCPSQSISLTGNTVTLQNGATVPGDVYGGFNFIDAGIVFGNMVTIRGAVTDYVYGGFADFGNANVDRNKVFVEATGSVGGWVSGGEVYLSSGTSGAYYNEATIRGAVTRAVHGGYAYSDGAATALGNEASVENTGNVAGDVWGGLAESDSAGASVTNNSVTINGGQARAAIGGQAKGSGGTGTATGNLVTVTNTNHAPASSAAIIGAHVEADGNASAVNNRIIVEGSTVLEVLSARAWSDTGSAAISRTNNDDTITITNSSVEEVCGGDAESTDGNATISGSRIIITGSTVRSGPIFGGHADSFDASANVSNNEIRITNSTVTGGIYGGKPEASSFSAALGDPATGTATANNNKIFITGGSVTGDIYAGAIWHTYGGATVSNSSIEISGNAVVDGNIFAADICSWLGLGAATNNTVTISGTPNFAAGVGLYGGVSCFGVAMPPITSTGNTLNLRLDPTVRSLTVTALEGFQRLNFTLPANFAAGRALLPKLNVTTPVDLSNLRIDVDFAGAPVTPLAQGQEFVLLEATAFNGALPAHSGRIRNFNYTLEVDNAANQIYLVIGARNDPNTSPIPTTGSAALIALGLLLAGLAAVGIRRRTAIVQR